MIEFIKNPSRHSNLEHRYGNMSWGNTKLDASSFQRQKSIFSPKQESILPPSPVPFDVWVSGSYIRHRGQKPEKASQFTGRLQRERPLLHRWSQESRGVPLGSLLIRQTWMEPTAGIKQVHCCACNTHRFMSENGSSRAWSPEAREG